MSALPVRRVVDDALDLWFAPAPDARLAVFSRALSLTFLCYFATWAQHAREWLTSAGFHHTRATLSAAYPDPLPLVPPTLLVPVVVVVVIATLHEIARPLTRVGTPLMLVLAVYLQGVDQIAAFTMNKLYVVGYALLALSFAATPCGVDDDGRRVRSAWPLRTLQATPLIQYFTAGTCKLVFGDWLSRPDVLFTHVVGVYRTELAGLAIAHAPRAAWTLLAWGALLFELCAPVLFLVRRLRLTGALMGVAFHGAVALFMKDLIFFSVQMVSFYVLFLDDEVARRWSRPWPGRATPAPRATTASGAESA